MADRPRVVLWGGRPGIDYQLGSPSDLHVARALEFRAGMRRIGAALRSSVEGAVVVMGEFAAAFQRARTALGVEEREANGE